MALSSNRTPDYVLGRGKVYFARFTSGQTPGPFRYVGNTPEFNLTIESETLDHFSSDEGIREKDDSVALEVTRSGTLIMDDINKDNIALFFFGSTQTVTTVAAAAQQEIIASVDQGDVHQLGLTTSDRVGTRGIENFVLNGSGGSPTYVLDTDYSVDLDRGMLSILEGGGIADGTANLEANFDIRASTQEQVQSGSEPVEGAMRLIENNPKGTDRDVFLPYIKLTPNGDYSLKGDEWRQIPLTIEALKPSSGEAIYVNGIPAYS